ncbi:MAG TPA: SirB2 family protein [Gammaproteobacteria bacterium]|nr:SirB2 family protein [Gammaproteobacteria bacterium]
MIYTSVKLIHMTCVGISVSLFAARGVWVLASGRRLWRWLRVVPHFIDTLLLASGLTLAFLIRQFPFVNSDWLTAKIIGLIAYIILGMLVFRGSRSRATRWTIWAMALIVFGYIVSVAITKEPTGFLTGVV